PQNYQPGERQSYAREWLPAASQAGKAHSEFVQPLPFTLPETVPLETLQRFWAHPVRAFFQNKWLGVWDFAVFSTEVHLQT
ncbi:hypothetical protein ACUOFC_64240, partial [Escherichia sp. TWPC-MK]